MTNPELPSPVLEAAPAPVPAPPTVVVHTPPPAPAATLKSAGVAYALLIVLGLFGVHHFYLGKTGRGLLYLFTLGGGLVGLVVDLFTLGAQVRQVNTQRIVGTR